jgi:hypothetical protein
MMRVTLLFGLLAFTSSGHGAALVDRSSNTGQSSPLVIPSPLSMAAQEQAFSCNVAHSSRTDCGYLGTTKDDCERKGSLILFQHGFFKRHPSGCCWSPTEMDGVPWCFHRDSTACAGYRLVSSSETAQSLTALLELKGNIKTLLLLLLILLMDIIIIFFNHKLNIRRLSSLRTGCETLEIASNL